MPVSAVLANDDVMLNIKPGQHGSTYGGNPLACRIAQEALEILKDEGLEQRSFDMGKILRERLRDTVGDDRLVSLVRGRGLLNAMIIRPFTTKSGRTVTASDVCMTLAEKGLLCKPTHGDIIRLAPPLVITEEQVEECAAIIVGVLNQYEEMRAE